jgi:hypothetical protein
MTQQRDLAMFKYEAATGTPLVLSDAGGGGGPESVVAGQSARIHHLTQVMRRSFGGLFVFLFHSLVQELLKERQATATLKAKMAEQQRMLCKDLQVKTTRPNPYNTKHKTRYNHAPSWSLQVLSERNREIKALEKEKHSLAKRISGADAFASPRPATASSHPSTPARATPRTNNNAKCQLEAVSPAGAIGTPVSDVDKFNELTLSPHDGAVIGADSPGTLVLEEAGFEGEREVAEEEKRRRLELKAIDNEVCCGAVFIADFAFVKRA